MFNGNVENIQLTRQLFASVALKIAEVWITEDKIFLFYPGNYVICKPSVSEPIKSLCF